MYEIIALLVFLTITRGLIESVFLSKLDVSNLVVSSMSRSSVVAHCPGQNLLWLDGMKSYLIRLPFGFTLTIENRQEWRGEMRL